MIRSSALYISLIISILIALICGSILLAGFMYKMQGSKLRRNDMLNRNAASASLLVMQDSFIYDSVRRIKLFENDEETGDSVILEKRQWGLYELGLVASFKNTDSVKKAFLIGSPLKDTATALYIADEDRPLSISGKSKIQGIAYLPKSGIKAAYVGESHYEGKRLVFGKMKESKRELPLPDTTLINSLNKLLVKTGYFEEEVLPESLTQSFFKQVKRVHLPKEHSVISNNKIRGNIIISSDSLIQVDSLSTLDQVILVAPYVKISSGFKGRLQIIASDSISIGSSVQLIYPSALVLLKPDTAGFQPKISIGKNSEVQGQLFAWEKTRSQMMPIIEIGQGSIIKGEIWSKGYVELGKFSIVNGSVSAIRLMANISSIIYENYLIDVIINRSKLSRYYTGSKMFNSARKTGSLLCQLQ
jgi:hypothetical protein